MARGRLVLAIALAISYRLDQLSEARLPSYHVFQRAPSMISECPEEVFAKCLEVVTEATSEEDFALLTEHFHDENPNHAAVLVYFYRNPNSDHVAQGAWVDDEQA